MAREPKFLHHWFNEFSVISLFRIPTYDEIVGDEEEVLEMSKWVQKDLSA